MKVYAVQVKNSQLIKFAFAVLQKLVALDTHGKLISIARVIRLKSVAVLTLL